MNRFPGLSRTEAIKILAENGPNEIPSQKPKNFFHLIRIVLSEPMILLLVSVGIIYLFLGEPRDSFVLLVSIFFIIAITVFQERKSERALQALRDLSAPKALVIRNGEQIRIPSREVVTGDIIMLQEGDRIPADAAVLESQNLMVDESLLTGESLSVRKDVWDGATPIRMGAENPFHVFSGTLIAQGSGIARVILTGQQTEMGKIGKSLQTIVEEDSLLKKEVGQIVRLLSAVGLFSCLTIFLIVFFTKGDLLGGLLQGLTLSMALLPEELPVVLTIFLTLGAWRISKENVLTRNNQAIETLGATSVLCVDKTGTLTANRMDLVTLTTAAKTYDLSLSADPLPDDMSELLLYSKLASKRSAFDPLEKEINSKFETLTDKGNNPIRDWHLIKSYGLSKNLTAMSRIWRSPTQKKLVISSKGSPEAVMTLCGLDQKEQERWQEKIVGMSNRGQRVLGVAGGEFEGENLPESQENLNLSFIGLIGFSDPLRSNIPSSMAECYRAGIRVIMITGDHPGTAQYIAAAAGLKDPDKYISGEELENMHIDELRHRIATTNVFARIVPDQKLKIVEALKANGEIVTMTGDGVNDGPALKAAHIGIAMGERGTDVARESADLVLLDDDFSSIVSAVRLGRRIFDNLQKAVSFIFSVHIPIAGISLLPAFFGMPLILFPIHIAFLELIIDPSSSIVFESEPAEHDIMKRPPRSLGEPLFSRRYLVRGLVRGLIIMVLVMTTYVISLSTGRSEGVARFLAFITLVFCDLVLVRSNLTRTPIFKDLKMHKNSSFSIIFLAAFTAVMVISSNRFLQDLFHFAPVHITDLLLVFALSLICFLIFESMKLFTNPPQVVSPKY